MTLPMEPKSLTDLGEFMRRWYRANGFVIDLFMQPLPPEAVKQLVKDYTVYLASLALQWEKLAKDALEVQLPRPILERK